MFIGKSTDKRVDGISFFLDEIKETAFLLALTIELRRAFRSFFLQDIVYFRRNLMYHSRTLEYLNRCVHRYVNINLQCFLHYLIVTREKKKTFSLNNGNKQIDRFKSVIDM